MVVWANGGGGAHSFEMYLTWLSDSGYREIEQLSERWVIAIKSTLYSYLRWSNI